MPGNKRITRPIVSEKQRRFFAAELERKRRGKKGRMPDMPAKDIAAHLRQTKGSHMPMMTRTPEYSGLVRRAD